MKPEKKEEKRLKKEKKAKNREFVIIAYMFAALFVALSAYFCYFLTFKSDDFINSSYNPRLNSLQTANIRGDIITSDGETVATTLTFGPIEKRSYPKGREYCHAVGYAINGMSGVEKEASFRMVRSHDFIIRRLYNDITDQKNRGDTAVLTINSKLQDAAYDAMDDYQGAVIALDPDTGKVLCMVSQPTFDPNTLADDWDSIVSDETSSVLLNRATQGKYPPGSTFKIVTALEYLNEGGKADAPYNCEGEFSFEGTTIHCYKGKVHGEQNFTNAFANSCNSAFAEIGLNLDVKQYGKLCDRLLFNKKLPTKIADAGKSSFVLSKDDNSSMLMQTAIGQGDTLVTPLHMAMIASAIANDGTLYKPYTLDKIQSPGGAIVMPYFKSRYGDIMSKEEAGNLKWLMRSVVTDGTGSALMTDKYDAYGKTGTAEFSSNKDEAHSWFVGFAEKDGKKIAIAVVMEGAGSGSAHAVPLAKSVFDAYFQ